MSDPQTGDASERIRWKEQYEPKGELARWWDHRLAATVFEVLDALDLPGDASFERHVPVVGHFLGWCRAQGLPLDWQVCFDPAVLERYTAVDRRSDRTKATYRSLIRRAGRRVNPAAPWVPKPVELAYQSVAVPYSATEVLGLRRLAEDQPSRGRWRIATATLYLGVGAGLDGRWLTQIRGTDVRVTGGLVSVIVPHPAPRVVPVRHDFAGDLLAFASLLGEERLVGEGPDSSNRSNRMQSRIVQSADGPRLTAKRARSTWLAWHVTRGTRIPELLAAAGLQNVTGLRDIVQHVAPMSPEAAATMLGGAR